MRFCTYFVLVVLALCIINIDIVQAKPKSSKTAKQTPKKRGMRDWGKITTKDLEAIEDEWAADDEEDPDDEPIRSSSQHKPDDRGLKTEMVFCDLDPKVVLTKDATDELAGRWTALMQTGGLDLKLYAIDTAKLLIVGKGHREITQLMEFVMGQPETIDFTWNQQKTTKAEWRKKRGEL